MNGIAIWADNYLAQIHWEYRPDAQTQFQFPEAPLQEDHQRNLIISSGIASLEKHGEPIPYIIAYTYALLTIIENQLLLKNGQISSGDEYSRIDQLIENEISFKNNFIRYGGGEKSFETARIWHQDFQYPSATISDQVEIEVYQLMAEHSAEIKLFIDQSICDIFPGLMTPNMALINACIESYCDDHSLGSGNIVLRQSR